MEDLIQNNKLTIIGKLTAGLLHEIRNPLTAIKLNLDYMKMYERELSGEITESITSSLEAFERINHIISDVLDFTKKNNEQNKGASLNKVTERAIEIIYSTASKRGIATEKRLDTNIPDVVANENKLLQVILNLMNNAIEASQNKSKIIVSTFEENGTDRKKVIWQVEDFGCGINPENVQKIQNGFYTSKSEGSGVGLMVCKRILDEMHADLLFESSYGKGSKFYIMFNAY